MVIFVDLFRKAALIFIGFFHIVFLLSTLFIISLIFVISFLLLIGLSFSSFVDILILFMHHFPGFL